MLGLDGSARASSRAAVRRSTAAGSDGPRDRARAEGVPHGRAALQSRRKAPSGDARVTRAAARAAGSHDRLRDPRPGGSDDARTAGRGHARRADSSGRHASAPVRAAEGPLRGRVHRLAGDESRGSDDRRRRSRFRAVSISARARDGARSRVRVASFSAFGPRASRTRHSRPQTFLAFDVEVAVVEELGSDAHVFFPVAAPLDHAGRAGDEGEDGAPLVASEVALLNARVDPRTAARVGGTLRLVVDPARFHFFDPERRDSTCSSTNALDGTDQLMTPTGGGRPLTKQSQTRDLVLDLIEELDVGEAIPSERQLSADLGVSRLTLRAALDDLAREGYVVRRRGSGTFVGEPKIAQELTMTSFTDDMRRRGMRPSSRTLELRVLPAGARLGRLLHLSPSEPVVRRQPPPAGRWREHGHRDGARAGEERLGPHRPGSRGDVVLRAPPGSLRHRRRRRHPDDRADRDGRRGVCGARASLCIRPPFASSASRTRRRARSSSSWSRSTAETATGSSRLSLFRRSDVGTRAPSWAEVDGQAVSRAARRG